MAPLHKLFCQGLEMIYILPRKEEENCAFKANFLKGRLGDRGHWEETKPLVWKEAGGGSL